MRWTKRLRSAGSRGIGSVLREHKVLALICALYVVCVSVLAQDEKRLSVYTPQTSYALPVVEREGAPYAGLLEILEPMGAVSARQDGTKWKLKFNDREAQFTLLKEKAKVGRRDLQLSSPFLIENGRGLVPLHSLANILSGLLADTAVDFHEGARRLFIGGVEQHSSTEFAKPASGRLVLSFAAPVNPFVATEPGKLRLVFWREPVLPKPGTLHFPDTLIPSLSYAESNGAAEVTVVGSVPLMATFSDDRKTITIAALAPPPATSPGQVAAPANPSAEAGAQPRRNGNVQPERPRFFVLIDASHGGDDHGGTISAGIAEKDVTLAFARRLSKELESRGIAARMLRDGDINIALEQRANVANVSGASLFISLHATGSGQGVRVYTSNLPPVAKAAAFLPWESAQSANLEISTLMAANTAAELLKHDIPALPLASSVRPLNNVAAPAVAIEVAAPPKGAVDELNSAAYQQSVCSAIAAAVVATRAKLPHGESSPGH